MNRKSTYFIRMVLVVCGSWFSQVHSAFADMNRVRLMIPLSEQATIDYGNSALEEKTAPTTSGYGVSYILPMGLGFGVTALATKTSAEVDFSSLCCVIEETLEYKSTFLDLSYTFGEKLSLTVGLGYALSGSGKAKLSYDYTVDPALFGASDDFSVSITTTEARGSAFFLNVGYLFDPVEILLGYRKNNLVYAFDFEDYDISGESTFDHTVDTGEIMIGAGWTF